MITVPDFISCSFPFLALVGDVIVIVGASEFVSTIEGGVPPGKVYFDTSTLGIKVIANVDVFENLILVLGSSFTGLAVV
jgi:hypothetical protein